MPSWTRRELIRAGLGASMGLLAGSGGDAAPEAANVHDHLLRLADELEAKRKARFALVTSSDELSVLQKELRAAFLRLIGGLPQPEGRPSAQVLGTIDGGDYLIEKLVFESFPGYFVPSLLYRPKTARRPLAAVLSPCGHSTVGKAEGTYQTLHVNLVKRGFVVLTYDPVGQGERSQFWDQQRSRSRYNLSCGEHAVLGNPLYLIGSSLARYRIWDGLRGLDYLASRPEVDSKRMGCVGNSGGGTLTAYIAALDPRVAAAAICCYITTLPRRMRNRIQEDPSADPEQDIFGFVSEGIDHAGLLALRAPRPTLLGTARFDFFPIEGARESFAEAKRLFELAGAGERIERVEANQRHGLSKPLRLAVYSWFDRWLAGRAGPADFGEAPFSPRPAHELLVCADGQANRTFHSRPLLPMALEEFDRKKQPPRTRLKDLLRLDPELARPGIREVGDSKGQGKSLMLCVNGNESSVWHGETEFLNEMRRRGHRVFVIEPRGVGSTRARVASREGDYADPLGGVEENVAYNAFLVGKSLLGMRVADLLEAITALKARWNPERITVCGRRDAALVACLTAAVEPRVTYLAVEELLLSFRCLFSAQATPINAASILPGLLEQFGDVPDILAQIAPRKILIAAGRGEIGPRASSLQTVASRFSDQPRLLADWLEG